MEHHFWEVTAIILVYEFPVYQRFILIFVMAFDQRSLKNFCNPLDIKNL